ncbi:thymidylate synthase [Candidatus Pseudomonas adelgestsugas]|uniref:Thymidylate synthase n=1 Tax=Candidatus Pseudomonas adelgestsugas TaxID=1302376 RepID=A0ABX5R725_9PSED|nr:thymidylate synthase [Candidatus Pseudomonas adelgestsugas]QAX81444.1 Thymidylate synthase [Candidatus Pseudomonas adelgestsugas]
MKQYLALLNEVITKGLTKSDRTSTGTKAVFARQYRHNLADGFPLLTTKKLHFKSIANELIWMLSGNTNIKWLNENSVKIWDKWATEDGNLGPVYGKQWTAWPTKDGGKINQIDYIVCTLKNNPNSRRILFHGWNVEYLPDETKSPQENAHGGKQALPPCHVLYQAFVHDSYLSMQVYIRSSDVFLGLPYNTAALALLTHMLAQQCDLIPHEIIVTTGDTHAYSNHIEQIYTQLARTPKKLPELVINRKPASIYDYKFEDFAIVGYDADPSIKANVAM